MNLLLVVLVILTLLILNEWWWRKRTHGEASRKFVHITVGSFVALWPLLLSWQQIIILSLLLVAAVAVSRQFNIFKAIHAVERPTWGELYFGASVGIIAVATRDPAIYAVALLHMSLADGLAAVVGDKYGKKTTYKVFGAKKSQVGTTTFLAVSAAILVAYSIQQEVNLGLWLAVIVGGSALLENVAVRGLDNLLIPLYVAAVLQAVS